MDFFAVNGKRPVRLSEDTRKFAYESLNHKYGLEALETLRVTLDHIEGYQAMPRYEMYNCAISEIVKSSPIRICDGELLSGAATLGGAIYNEIPASFKNAVWYGTNHLTADFESVLNIGVDGIREKVKKSLTEHDEPEKIDFLNSCLHCIDCMELWRDRYIAALKEKGGFEDNIKNLCVVPFKPATNFYEAVQSIWFTFAFLRICGNWPGIGRIDWLLGKYLEKDLADGTITIDKAREILAHFFIKGCEWITGKSFGSGDAQHYQNIVLGGIDENGKDVTNTVTYLVLDVIEELGIGDFPTTVRINKNTDKKLLDRVAEVIRLGGGVIAIYNEDLIIESLVNYGYELSEARKFANDGCWEMQVPGKTYFAYMPFDGLQILQHTTLKGYSGEACFDSFDELYNAYIKDLTGKVHELVAGLNMRTFADTTGDPENWKWKNSYCVQTVMSIFEQGCIEKGLPYFEGGPIYNVTSPHIGGLPDVVNSLYAIKKLVFDDKKVSFTELMKILKNDWQDNEELRQYAINKYSYFGNDNDEVDEISKNIINDFADACDEAGKRSAFKIPAGISTFGRQIEWARNRMATPYGKTARSVLSGNYSPTPGTDKEGATAIIRSCCKADLRRTVSGAALDIKLLPSAVNGNDGIDAVVSLIRGFVSLGGSFMQLDVADTQLLKEAQLHPEDYQTLSVRVSGWNARFVTLNKEWQDMIISQTGSEM